MTCRNVLSVRGAVTFYMKAQSLNLQMKFYSSMRGNALNAARNYLCSQLMSK